MTRVLFLAWALITSLSCVAQDLKAEYDPKTDFSRYKTFSFGEGEIITPEELRQLPDSILHRWVKSSITTELTRKGLTRVKDSADLVVSYITGSQQKKESIKNGPLGLTPGGNPDLKYEHNYSTGSLVIDLNDRKNNKLVWRVNASVNANITDSEEFINQIVLKGFRKFSTKPKKIKRKK